MSAVHSPPPYKVEDVWNVVDVNGRLIAACGVDSGISKEEKIANAEFLARAASASTTPLSGSELAQALIKVINLMGDEKEAKAFVNSIMNSHRTLRQGVFNRIVVPMIKEAAQAFSEGRYDGRNEASVTMCHKIINALDERDLALPLV